MLIDFFNLFFPKQCITCGNNLNKNYENICFKCTIDLPLTNFTQTANNQLEQQLWGRVNINAGTSLMYFRKATKSQIIIHDLKYRGNKKIGVEFGKKIAYSIKNARRFKNIDIIIPVPLHKVREKSRGYNQSYIICIGISEVLNIEISTGNLIRNKHTETQTKKGVYERWENISSVFTVLDSSKFINKHILIVDDVFTTGATIEGCAQELLKIKNVTVSVATLGYSGE